MTLPVHDWQFWVVTAAALGVVVLAVRSLVRSVTRKKQSTRVGLTVERREPGSRD